MNSTSNAAQNPNTARSDIMLICSKYRWDQQGIMQGTPQHNTPAQWFKANTRQLSQRTCSVCNSLSIKEIVFRSMPLFLRFKAEDVTVKWSLTMELGPYQYRLCGFIYHGGYHFTSRVVEPDGRVYYNNAAQFGRKYSYEKKLTEFTPRQLLSAPQDRRLILAIYTRTQQSSGIQIDINK